jgi:hypothetical protein
MTKDIKKQLINLYLSLNQNHEAMKTKIITGILLLLMTGMSATAQNLLINGDFEASDPDGTPPKVGWKFDWTPVESGVATTSSAARTGNCGLWIYTAMNGNNPYTTSYQEVSCRPSTNYRAEIYLRTPPRDGKWVPGSSAYISLTFKNSSGVTISRVTSDKFTTVNNEWKLYSINVLSPEKSAMVRYTIHLEAKKGQSICNADNCSLTVAR